MPKIINASEKMQLISMIKSNIGQREIERETGFSRPYIRKVAREIGHQFPRNGVEVLSSVCMCSNCGSIFRRPKSKIDRSKNQFCDESCKAIYQVGPLHPSWKKGKYSNSFSQWSKNQTDYFTWRQKVLEKAGYKCEITGNTNLDELDCHHIFDKATYQHLAFEPKNGIVLSKEIHKKIHSMIREGVGFEEAIEKLKQEYKNINENVNI